MDSDVAIVIVGGLSFASPLLLAYLTGRRQDRQRAEDFKRQDEVAAAARTATIEVTSQLKQIHTLVNSDMTAARQAELDQTRMTLTLLKEIVATGEAAGRAGSLAQLEAIKSAEAHIEELEAILADRMAQMKIVEAEKASAAAAKEFDSRA